MKLRITRMIAIPSQSNFRLVKAKGIKPPAAWQLCGVMEPSVAYSKFSIKIPSTTALFLPLEKF
jgi:hypothetical protein